MGRKHGVREGRMWRCLRVKGELWLMGGGGGGDKGEVDLRWMISP